MNSINAENPVEVKNVTGLRTSAALLEAFLGRFKKDTDVIESASADKTSESAEVFLDLGGIKLSALDDW
jgi:hypothetical protein